MLITHLGGCLIFLFKIFFFKMHTIINLEVNKRRGILISRTLKTFSFYNSGMHSITTYYKTFSIKFIVIVSLY